MNATGTDDLILSLVPLTVLLAISLVALIRLRPEPSLDLDAEQDLENRTTAFMNDLRAGASERARADERKQASERDVAAEWRELRARQLPRILAGVSPFGGITISMAGLAIAVPAFPTFPPLSPGWARFCGGAGAFLAAIAVVSAGSELRRDLSDRRDRAETDLSPNVEEGGYARGGEAALRVRRLSEAAEKKAQQYCDRLARVVERKARRRGSKTGVGIAQVNWAWDKVVRLPASDAATDAAESRLSAIRLPVASVVAALAFAGITYFGYSWLRPRLPVGQFWPFLAIFGALIMTYVLFLNGVRFTTAVWQHRHLFFNTVGSAVSGSVSRLVWLVRRDQVPGQGPASRPAEPPSSRGAVWAALSPASMPAWATLAVAGLVGMAETGAVIQSAVPGEAFPTSSVFGPGRLTSPMSTGQGALAAWASLAKNQPGMSNWLLWHLGFNLLFLVGYFTFAAAAICLLAKPGTKSDQHVTTGRRLLVATGAEHLALIVAACVCILGWIRPGRNPGTVWAVALQVLDLATWAAALWLIGWFCYRAADRRAELRPWAQAAKMQRFSLVIAVVLIVVAILPGTNVLEQIPDVQRAWIGSRGVATAALGAATGAQILLAIVMFRIGRLRMTRVRQRSDKFPDVQRSPEPRYRGWFITSAAFLLVAGLLWVSGQARVGLTVAVIPGVLCVVAVISWLANRATHKPGNGNPPQQEPTDLSTPVLALGDGIAVAVLAIPGLGLVRSFTTPALVGVGSYAWDARAAVLIGIALSAVVWPCARWVRRVYPRLTFLTRPKLGGSKIRSRVLLSASILFYLGALVWLVRWPLQASARLGVVGTATIALGALAMIMALLAHLAQNREPLPLFRLLRLKTTPVLSILAFIGIIGIGVGQSSALHEITQNPAVQVTSRQPLMQKLAAWLAAPQRYCIPNVIHASDGQAVQVRPLVLVAAAGGGIRAAWWTASALTSLADNECGRESVFAVSSVSGSSLGTAVVATASGQGSSLWNSVTTSLDRLAQPPALASGIDGLVLRDTVAGLTGLTLRAASMPTGPEFPDRAALIQQAWINADQGLGQPFLGRPAASLPWQLLFNSTAVRSGCQVIIASAAVGPAVSPARHTPRCLQISGQPFAGSGLPDAYDLFAQLPCLNHITVATAAMLSARFAYVTPSSEVPGCAGPGHSQPTGQLVEQYIDGGYSDPSGLQTLQAIMPELLELIAQHNDAQLVKAGAGPVSIVVPIVAYLANTPIVKPLGPQGLLPQAAEPTIPLSATGAATGQLNGQTVLLQDLAAYISRNQWLPCSRGDTRCASAAQALRGFVTSQIVVVAPRQQPGAFAVPLGWVLSQASEQSLTSDLTTEATRPCNADGIYCAPGTQGLHYLLNLTRTGAPS